MRVLATLALSLLVAAPLAAEHVRVVSGPAPVMRWRMAGETIAILPAGTMVEVIDREDNWFWVMLPPDQNGTHRVGWIEGSRVDPAAAATEPLMHLAPSARETAGNGRAPHGDGVLPSTRIRRWQLQAMGGMTFGTETSQHFAGAAGFRWSPNRWSRWRPGGSTI
jgi:hypothetical protein